jgi:pSer/pThr/pTyr-binding forkhead associated (FHA) protein
MEGKSIPITLTQFLIGRDPQCHLRPASALISKRHCALLIRGDKVFVRDFNSTNGTLVNTQRVTTEQELKNDDHLTVGPLEFRVCMEVTTPVSKPTPLPSPPVATADDAAAAVLLSLQDECPVPGSPGVDSEGIPTGSTVMEMLPAGAEPPKEKEEEQPKQDKAAAAKTASGNTSSAAKAILEKYMRRPRGG